MEVLQLLQTQNKTYNKQKWIAKLLKYQLFHQLTTKQVHLVGSLKVKIHHQTNNYRHLLQKPNQSNLRLQIRALQET